MYCSGRPGAAAQPVRLQSTPGTRRLRRMIRNRLVRAIMSKGSLSGRTTSLLTGQMCWLLRRAGFQATLILRRCAFRLRGRCKRHAPFGTIEAIHRPRDLATMNSDIVEGAVIKRGQRCNHLASLPFFEGGAQPAAEWAIGDRFGDVARHRDRHVSFRS